MARHCIMHSSFVLLCQHCLSCRQSKKNKRAQTWGKFSVNLSPVPKISRLIIIMLSLEAVKLFWNIGTLNFALNLCSVFETLFVHVSFYWPCQTCSWSNQENVKSLEISQRSLRAKQRSFVCFAVKTEALLFDCDGMPLISFEDVWEDDMQFRIFLQAWLLVNHARIKVLWYNALEKHYSAWVATPLLFPSHLDDVVFEPSLNKLNEWMNYLTTSLSTLSQWWHPGCMVTTSLGKPIMQNCL